MTATHKRRKIALAQERRENQQIIEEQKEHWKTTIRLAEKKWGIHSNSCRKSVWCGKSWAKRPSYVAKILSWLSIGRSLTAGHWFRCRWIRLLGKSVSWSLTCWSYKRCIKSSSVASGTKSKACRNPIIEALVSGILKGFASKILGNATISHICYFLLLLLFAGRRSPRTGITKLQSYGNSQVSWRMNWPEWQRSWSQILSWLRPWHRQLRSS